jgi:UDP-N-acetyl-D-mannosaminuronic acid dehydrogenase
MQSGKLKVQSRPEKADVFIIAVPTPCRKFAVGEAKKADLSYVEKASNDILPYLQKGNLVVLESTVPPGTTEDVVGSILERGGFKVGEDIHLAFALERVLPGRIMIELTGNDRIIGGVTREAAKRGRDFYATFVSGRIHLCNARTAEMAKLIENTYRDVNIALANELALLAEKAGVNSYEAIDLANNHPRVNVLKPGPGVGGHCIAEDPYFLIEISNELSPLLQLARRINMGMPLHERIQA